MTEESLSHINGDCTYRLVWIPKYRRKVLFGKHRAEIVAIVKTLPANKGIQIVEGACCRDHVDLKGKSVLMIYDRHPEWRRHREGR